MGTLPIASNESIEVFGGAFFPHRILMCGGESGARSVNPAAPGVSRQSMLALANRCI